MNPTDFKNQKSTKYGKQTTVCFIFNHSFFLGGGEVSFFELIRTLDKKRIRPVVIVPDSGEIERNLKDNNIEVHIVRFPPIKNLIKFSPLKAFLDLLKIFKKRKIEIIHINGSRACFYGGITGRILRIPIIWHVRESLTDFKIYDWLLGSLADVIICVSKSVKLKRFKKFEKRISRKICIVYNGVDTSKFQKNMKSRQKIRALFSVKDSDILIGLIGNLIPRKAQDFFLKGFAKSKQIQPDISAKILIIGHFSDKKYYYYLQKLVDELKIDSNVIFQKFSKDISNILSALDIFVLSSKSEGFSRSLLEAMSCGLPVIGTKISENKEAIVDNKNGLLVDFMDINKMALAIITLYKNEIMCKKIGSYNRSLVEKCFNLVSHANQIEFIYSDILREKRIFFSCK